MKKTLFLVLIVLFAKANAQNGTNVYSFMNLPSSARQAALGGDAITIRDNDVSMLASNPSLLNLEMHHVFSIDVSSYLADSKYGTFAYARDLSEGHLMTVNAKYMDYGEFKRTDVDGVINGEFKATDAAFGIGYAYQFEEDWTVGTQINYINSKIDNYTSSAIAANFAITYHSKKRKETAAITLRNFGYQIDSYNGEREKMPFRIDLGYTRILDKFPVALTVTAHNIQKFDITSPYNRDGKETGFGRKIFDHLSLGAELFPTKAFNIRLGYNAKRGNELSITDQRSFSGLSAGFGLRFSNIKINYSHQRFHNSSNANMLGIGIAL